MYVGAGLLKMLVPAKITIGAVAADAPGQLHKDLLHLLRRDLCLLLPVLLKAFGEPAECPGEILDPVISQHPYILPGKGILLLFPDIVFYQMQDPPGDGEKNDPRRDHGAQLDDPGNLTFGRIGKDTGHNKKSCRASYLSQPAEGAHTDSQQTINADHHHTAAGQRRQYPAGGTRHGPRGRPVPVTHQKDDEIADGGGHGKNTVHFPGNPVEHSKYQGQKADQFLVSRHPVPLRIEDKPDGPLVHIGQRQHGGTLQYAEPEHLPRIDRQNAQSRPQKQVQSPAQGGQEQRSDPALIDLLLKMLHSENNSK